MATKQQLKSQLDVLRDENQRLESLLQQRTLRSPLTPTTARSEKAREEAAAKELSAVRKENEQLRDKVQELEEKVQLVRRQKEDDEAELMRLRQETMNSEALDTSTAIETLRQELARVTQDAEAAERRAKTAEEEFAKLSSEYSHQRDTAELQQLRALAEQQRKWELREQHMEELLTKLRKQLHQEGEERERYEERSQKLILQAQEKAIAYEQQLRELQRLLSESEERERTVTAELCEKNHRIEELNYQVAYVQRQGGTEKAEVRLTSQEKVLQSSEGVGAEGTNRCPPPLFHVPSMPATRDALLAEVPVSATYTHPYSQPTQQVAVQMLSSVAHQLPTLPEFTGEDEKRDGSFVE